MLSGRRLDLINPSPLDIEIEDIAHGLARVARWNGQTKGRHAFSVAQHSVLVEALLRDAWPDTPAASLAAALLHDAPEYVIGDMISPFKTVLGGDYKEIEARLSEAIFLRFGLPARMPAELKARIKRADQASAYFEATRLAGFGPEEAEALFGLPAPGADPDMSPLSPTEAQTLFLNRFNTLMREVDAAKAGLRQAR